MLDKTLFYRVFHYSAHELFFYAEHLLTSYGYTVQKSHDDAEPDWLVAAPPDDAAHNGICLVAHCDTIIRKDGVDLVFEGPIVRNRFGVLGADDRAGVYTILSTVMNSEHRPPIILTNHEESGGLGVKELCRVTNFDKWLANRNIKLFVELDRANADDYVYYSYSLPERVQSWIESFGFKESHGSYSDVADLTRFSSIPHVNLSIGYKNQHGKNELLNVPDMLWTQAKLWHMLHDLDVPQGLLTKDEIDGPAYTYTRTLGYGGWSSKGAYSSYSNYKQQSRHFPPVYDIPHGNYNTPGSCYVCYAYGYMHDEWLVCETCLDAEDEKVAAAVNPPEEEEEETLARYNAEWAADWHTALQTSGGSRWQL